MSDNPSVVFVDIVLEERVDHDIGQMDSGVWFWTREILAYKYQSNPMKNCKLQISRCSGPAKY
jgi:hypothetical protein